MGSKTPNLTDTQSKILALRDEAYTGYTDTKADFSYLERGYMSIIDEGTRTSLRLRRKSTVQPMLIKPKSDAVRKDILRAFFSSDSFADIKAETVGDPNDERTAEALADELKDYVRESTLYLKTKTTLEPVLVYGTAIVKVWFNPTINNVVYEDVKLNSFYFDRGAPNANASTYFVQRSTSMTIAQLKKQYPKANIDWASHVGDSMDVQDSLPADAAIGDYQRPELVEVYRLKASKWYVSTLLGDEFLRTDKVLKDGHPFIFPQTSRQFVGIEETPVRAYGGSFISDMIPVQTEYVIRRNQQIDAIDAALNVKLLVNKNSGLREQDVNSTRKLVTVQNLADVKELPLPNINPAIFDVDKLEQEAEAISSVSKYSQGLGSDQNKSKTKGEAQILDARGSAVSEDLNRSLNETFFRPLATRIIMLIYKYKRSESFADVDRTKPMRQRVTIDVGTGSTNKEIKLQNIDEAIGASNMVMDMALKIQDLPRATQYMGVADELFRVKLKLLGQISILEKMEDSDDMVQQGQEQQQQMLPPQQEGMM